MSGKPNLLSVSNAVLEIEGATLLKDVSFELMSGQFTALIGPNGAGKSTLLKACAGLMGLSSGSVKVNGEPLDRLRVADRSRIIQFVGQSSFSNFGFSALEFVLMALTTRKGPLSLETSEDIEQALQAMDSLGVRELANQKVHTLSSGEFQRVVLAQSILVDAKLTLLDEPTSNLDLKHQFDVLGFLKSRITEENKRSSLVVMHDLNMVPAWFDHVILMNEGQIFASGLPSEVLRPDILEEVYAVKLRVIRDGGDEVLVRAR